MLRKAVFIACVFFAEFAFPISRIGNNNRIQDARDGYVFTIPPKFPSVTMVQDGGAVLASGLFASSPPLPVDIQIQSFRSQYQDLAGQGQKAIEDYFLSRPGIRYKNLKVNNGALTLFGESETSYVAVSVCGDGRGYVLFAQKLDLTAEGILHALQNTVFESPCRN
jgi:hypothetical protein